MVSDNGLASIEVVALQVSLSGISAAFQSAGHAHQFTHRHPRREWEPSRGGDLAANADGGRINLDETLVYEHTVSRQQMQVSSCVSRQRLGEIHVEELGFALIVAEDLRVAQIGVRRKAARQKDSVPQGQVAISFVDAGFTHLTVDHDRTRILEIKPAEDSYRLEWLQRWSLRTGLVDNGAELEWQT